MNLTNTMIPNIASLEEAIQTALSTNNISQAIQLYCLNLTFFTKDHTHLAEQFSKEFLSQYDGRFRLVGKMGGTEIQWALATPHGIVTPILSRSTHSGNLNDSLAELEKDPDNSLENLMNRIVDPMNELASSVGIDRVEDYYFSAPGFFAADGSLAEDQTNVANMKKGFRFDTEIPIYFERRSGQKITGITIHDGTGHAFGDKSVYGPFNLDDTLYGFWVGTGIASRVSPPGLVSFTGGPEFNELHNELPHSTLWNPQLKRFEVIGDQTLGHRPTAEQKQKRESLEERCSGKALSSALIQEYEHVVQDENNPFYPEALEIKNQLTQLGKSTLDLEGVRALAKLKPAMMLRIYRQRAHELGLGIGALLTYLVSRPWINGSTFDLANIKIPIGGVIAQLDVLGLFAEVVTGILQELEQAGVDQSIRKHVANNISMSPLDDDLRELIGGLPTPKVKKTD